MRSHTYTEHCLRANSSIERHGGFRPLPRPMLPSGRPSISDSGPVIRRRQWICSPHQHQSSHGLSTPSQPSSLFVQMPLQSMVDSLPHRPPGNPAGGRTTARHGQWSAAVDVWLTRFSRFGPPSQDRPQFTTAIPLPDRGVAWACLCEMSCQISKRGRRS